MKIIEPGHVYDLNWLDGSPRTQVYETAGHKPIRESRLIFVNREEGDEHPGTQTQEVLRALIDRTMHCDNCERWDRNDEIIRHLRMALALHEVRALERKVALKGLEVERLHTGHDGHVLMTIEEPYSQDAATYVQKEKR